MNNKKKTIQINKIEIKESKSFVVGKERKGEKKKCGVKIKGLMVGSIYILSYHQNCWLMRAERESLRTRVLVRATTKKMTEGENYNSA
ncbi:MAG: hypothetical protein M5F18_08810 [Asgard group archaeon]|nr:hypothetical protein [Asgard group archaeon]